MSSSGLTQRHIDGAAEISQQSAVLVKNGRLFLQ